MTITADALSLAHDTYAVTMTNGSGVRELVLTGTQATVWAWCCRAGETRESSLAGYVPVAIRPATFGEQRGACICSGENYSARCPVDGLIDLVCL